MSADRVSGPVAARAPRTAAVVGGGISGLTAALELASAGVAVTVLEGSESLGGCLSRTDAGGLLPGGADDGAEAALHRRPEAPALMRRLGLAPVHPSAAHSSRILTRAGLAPIPRGTLMGVPGDPQAVAAVLSERGARRVAAETLTPPQTGDVSCGDFLAARLGDEVVDTLVDPLIGGVYAGRCRELSLAATVPALLPAAHAGTSVLEAVRTVLAERTRTQGSSIPGASGGSGQPPVFASLAGGISGLVPALAQRLRALGAEIRTGEAVLEVLLHDPEGRDEHAGAQGASVRTAHGVRQFDHVVIAVPAWAAAPLLEQSAPEASALLGTLEYASSAVLTAVVEDPADGAGEPLSGSGFLVPPALGTLLKASTLSSNKWPWLREVLPDGRHLVRMSIGRAGDTAWQARSDADLLAQALAEWREATGYAGTVLHSEVRRWDRALPQYAPGHADLAARIDAAAAHPALSLAGSHFEGVGIPACIARARTVAAALVGDSAET